MVGAGWGAAGRLDLPDPRSIHATHCRAMRRRARQSPPGSAYLVPWGGRRPRNLRLMMASCTDGVVQEKQPSVIDVGGGIMQGFPWGPGMPQRRTIVQGLAAVCMVVAALAISSAPSGAVGGRVKPPSAPTSVAVASADTALAVSWGAPLSDGGASVTGYVVTVEPGSATCSTASLACTVTGLANGKKYRLRVQAVNAVRAGRAARATAVPSTVQNCSYLGVWANLQSCDLAAASLKLTNLSDANLTDANLTGAVLLGANLTGANLTGADLTDANLEFADLNGVPLAGITWSNTTCPDGIPSDLVGDTCANDIDDEIAQANLTEVLSAANTSWTSNGNYSGVSTTSLQHADPTLSITAGPSTGPTSISIAVSTDGNGIVLGALSQTHIDTCWYLYDNQRPVAATSNPPWGGTPTGLVNEPVSFPPDQIVVPTSPDLYYAEVRNTSPSGCDASQPRGLPGTAYVYQTFDFPAL